MSSPKETSSPNNKNMEQEINIQTKMRKHASYLASLQPSRLVKHNSRVQKLESFARIKNTQRKVSRSKLFQKKIKQGSI
jgi:hypothetical protein